MSDSVEQLVNDYLTSLAIRKETVEKAKTGEYTPEMALRMLQDTGNIDMASLHSSTPEALEAGKLIHMADLSRKGMSLEILDENDPLYQKAIEFNQKANNISKLSLPMPDIWMVDGLNDQKGLFAAYQRIGDIIMIDKSLSEDEAVRGLAYEFGSRSTNHLYFEELQSHNDYWAGAALAEAGIPRTEKMEATVLISAKIQRQCEATESTIAAALLTPEKFLEPNFVLDDGPDSRSIDYEKYADHMAPDKERAYITALKENGFFKSPPIKLDSEYACDMPTPPGPTPESKLDTFNPAASRYYDNSPNFIKRKP